MKKIYTVGLFCLSLVSFAQIKTNQPVLQNTANNSSAFLDASSSPLWNPTSNQGKGLVFPRTNLTTLATLVQVGPNIPNNFPNRMDGMIVYNVGTGAPKINPTATPNVTPGFYYYENKTTNLQGGKWVRIGDGSANRVLEIATNEVATNVKVENNQVYTIKGQFTSDGSTQARINFPAGITSIYNIKIYKKTTSGSSQLVHAQLYDYNLTASSGNNVTFGSGVMSTSIPAGTYDYVLEYFK
ncbi:hypothetical protein [Bergeyella zoohelcum]|uniref:hypothetical protein n=1 Tax=Bergeyella zoohelcum TaxID=1015 RepID=UPI002A91F75E|nr:hypothetical protein [Bergeyella zoohelcum]MDY6025372.1 hypothetical protein [Bergeyella zoohelcum]